MDQELDKAIKIIEDRGGFVMLPESDTEERDIRKATHQAEKILDEREQEELDEASTDFESRKRTAFRRATRALNGKKEISYMDIDDIFFEEGIEPDYIEDWIESQI